MSFSRFIVGGLLLVGGFDVYPSLAASTKYPMGYIPADESVYSELPKVPRYRAFLPPKVDLSKSFPTPGMQDAESCSGWAVGYAARSYYTKTVDGRDTQQLENVPSPSYIYNQIRPRNNCSSGAMLLDALAVLGNGGLSGADYPMHTCRIPNPDERKRAKDFRIKKWIALDPKQLDDVKGQLSRGNPVIFGIDVRSGFEELKGDTVFRSSSEKVGKHAMTLVGYDDQRQAFKMINSWGTMWGDKGFGWIDYELFKGDAREAYVIEIATDDPPVNDQKPVEPEIASQEAEPATPTPQVVPAPVIQPAQPPTPVVKPSPPITPEQETANPSPPLERPATTADCSYVYSDKKGSRTKLVGFVESESDLKPLMVQWKGLVDDFDIEVRPWPQCEVLLNVASLLNTGSGLKVGTKTGAQRFTEGQEIAFQLTTPAMPEYVYAFYIQADGSVVTLLEPQSDLLPSRFSEDVVFGTGEGGTSRFSVTRPFGREMVLSLSSASPLFEGRLPKVQTEREFLSALRRAILYKNERLKDDRRISAAFVGVETEAKK